MAMPRQVSKKLEDALGEDAGSLMTDWLEELEATNVGTRAELTELRSAVIKLTEEVRLGFAGMNARFADVDAKFAGMDAKIAAGGERNAQQIASTLRWAITVWIASFGVGLGYLTWVVRGP